MANEIMGATKKLGKKVQGRPKANNPPAKIKIIVFFIINKFYQIKHDPT